MEEAIKKNYQASVFLEGLPDTDTHIVDTLIEERCPSFVSHWTWPVVRPTLYSMLGYRKARSMADALMQLNGRRSFEYLSQELQVDVSIDQLHHLPEKGRVVVAANHPTGLADGVAVWDALMQKRQDIVFFANADAIQQLQEQITELSQRPTLEEVRDARAGSVVLTADRENNEVILNLRVEETDDLKQGNWTIAEGGDLKLTLALAGDKRFMRIALGE